MTQEEIAVKLAEVDARSKSNTHRIDELKEATKALNSLAVSVEKIAVQQENLAKSYNGLTKDVEEIKSKPAKRWDAAVLALITALIGWAVGHFVG